jgi:tripartite-type tricarboxylate transporter receptor subunit TctC
MKTVVDGARCSTSGAVALALMVSAAAVPAAAQQDFYAGKTLTLTTGFGSGGGFDNYMRLVAQYLAEHIPGKPVIKPVNRPGAGGRLDANLVFSSDPKDGTHIALLAPWIATEPLFEVPGANFEPTKFNWLVSASRDVSTCMFWTRTGIRTFDDLVKKGEVSVGSTGPTAVTTTDALLLNAFFGTKIKVVHGFKGTNDAFLAAERGEMDGACGVWVSSVNSSYSAPIKSGAANVIVQLGTWRHPDFPKATHILEDLKPSPEATEVIRLVLGQLDMARPFVAPPGVPAERVAILRKAFESMLKDPKFLDTAKKRSLDVLPVSGDEIQRLIAKMYASPKHIVDQAKKLVGY